MGKKTKIGKQRKDRFYHLAKETGFRSRAAFKLIQLNRKFEFLQKSRVAIDLCAAPGGWLQVCRQHMPVSSIVIGVDLVPIKAIPNVMTFTDDITSPSCRSTLRRELKTWQADLVLHDGAPNVGKSWMHDAYAQNRLTLSALELAAEFLQEGGTFVSKIFRSKDYNALIWVLSKLFRKVSATKPAASRNESAEIFVVAQHFLAPAKIDPKFFNPTYLFDDTISHEHEDKKSKNNLLLPVSKQKKTKAEGYRDGETTQFISVKVSDIIRSHSHLELMSRANEIVFDEEEIRNHPATTSEIIECCRDLKVLGRKDILSLIKWRKKVRHDLGLDKKKEGENVKNVEDIEEEEPEDVMTDEERKMKRKKKKIADERRKLKERMKLKMIIKNDHLVEEGDEELFSLKKLRNQLALKEFEEFSMSEESDGEDQKSGKQVPKFASYDRNEKPDVEDSESESEKEETVDDEAVLSDDDAASGCSDGGDADSESAGNELVLDPLTRKDKTDLFFKKGIFSEVMDDSEDEEKEIIETLDQLEPETSAKKQTEEKKRRVWEFDDDEEESDDESESGPKLHPKCQKNVKLDPESLALAEKMIISSKTKRDLIDDGWNRYTRGDAEDAPSWFRKEEEKFFRKTLPVNPEAVQRYKEQQKALNVRPIKKVAEAKARKKKRVLQRLEKMKKRAELISETPDMTEKEKSAQLKNLYKKSMNKKKKEVSYVVAKKGRSLTRLPGLKGKYKMVDKRMKKDKRKRMTGDGKNKKKHHQKSGSGGGGGKGKIKGMNKRNAKNKRKK